jgi:hypothetical protein
MVSLLFLLLVKIFPFGNFVIQGPPASTSGGAAMGIVSHGFGKGQRIKVLGLNTAINRPHVMVRSFQVLSSRMERFTVDKLKEKFVSSSVGGTQNRTGCSCGYIP